MFFFFKKSYVHRHVLYIVLYEGEGRGEGRERGKAEGRGLPQVMATVED